MAWWEGVDEGRLLITPDPDVTGRGVGNLLSLRHPKSGNSSCYLFINETLQELHWFKQSYRSWFMGDYICEDGSLYTATQVDPVFLMLPIFEEARMKKLEDPGKFRPLDDIIYVDGYPGYRHLLPIIEKSMQVVCEVKEMGSVKFFRLDDTKVLAWLYFKAQQLKQILCEVDKNYAAQDEKETWAAVVSILGEYVKDEPWLKLLCNHLKINIPKAATEAQQQDMEILPASAEDSHGSSNFMKGKKVLQKGSAKNGKQAKRMKPELDSKNIKDMFSMVLRKRS